MGGDPNKATACGGRKKKQSIMHVVGGERNKATCVWGEEEKETKQHACGGRRKKQSNVRVGGGETKQHACGGRMKETKQRACGGMERNKATCMCVGGKKQSNMHVVGGERNKATCVWWEEKETKQRVWGEEEKETKQRACGGEGGKRKKQSNACSSLKFCVFFTFNFFSFCCCWFATLAKDSKPWSLYQLFGVCFLSVFQRILQSLLGQN